MHRIVGLVLVLAAALVAAPAASAEERVLIQGSLAGSGIPWKLEKHSLFGWDVVTVPDGSLPAVARAPGVKAAEPVVRAHASRVADDPYVDELWGFSAIGVEDAWDLSVGAARQRIGVVDTGTARGHVDLAPHDAGGFDFVSDPDDAGDGDGRDDDYEDEGGDNEFHGSHVAGTILARGDDGVGIPGVNWRAKLVTARALGQDGAGDLVDIMEAAAWLAGFDVDGAENVGGNEVRAINMSLGHAGACSRFERDITSAILARNVVIVAAAGNAGGPTEAPANCPGVIAVGAVDADFALASYSSFDARTDVLAPGGDGDSGILSVDGATLDGYKYLQGTSMAAPHVTGVVSLMQALNAALTPADIRDILRDSPYTCDGCADAAFLDARDAVERARPSTSDAGVVGGADDGGDDDGSGACDPARGNWDCPAGAGCVAGACVAGAFGRGALGDRCAGDGDCSSGLCDAGRCTKPCDDARCNGGGRCDACPGETECAPAVIPGGLCRSVHRAPSADAGTCAALSADSLFAVASLATALGARRRRRRRR